MENVFLYDVDDLSKVADENLSLRKKEAEAAERIVEREVHEFETWRRQQNLKPLIVGLRSHVRAIMAAEIERALPKLGGDAGANKEALDRAIDAAVSKLLHPTLAEIKRAAEEGQSHVLDDAPRLFGIDMAKLREGAAAHFPAAGSHPPAGAVPAAKKTEG